MIRFAVPEDLPHLLTLWQQAFGDSEEEARYYFDKRYQPGSLLVAQQPGGELGGMLSMLPLGLSGRDFALSARYVFAVATDLRFRNQGISSKLLTAAHQYAKEQGDSACVLVPAGDSLFDYYGKRGYQTAFWMKQFLFHPNALGNNPSWLNTQMQSAQQNLKNVEYTIASLSAQGWLDLRRQVFSKSALFADWGLDALTYIHQSLENGGAGIKLIQVKNRQAAAICEWRGQTLRVQEYLDAGLLWEEGLWLLHQQMQADNYLVRLPVDSDTNAPEVPFGMVHWLSPTPAITGTSPWLSLAKD